MQDFRFISVDYIYNCMCLETTINGEIANSNVQKEKLWVMLLIQCILRSMEFQCYNDATFLQFGYEGLAKLMTLAGHNIDT